MHNHFRPGQPLTAAGLYQLLTDEVLRDGKVDEQERSALLAIGRHLRLSAEQAREIFELSRSKFAAGVLGPTRAMDPLVLCETVLSYIFSDRTYSQEEEELFEGLRRIFGISDAQYLELMHRAFPKSPRSA